MIKRKAPPGVGDDSSRPRRGGFTGNDQGWLGMGVGEGRLGAPWHPQRDLGPGPPSVAVSTAHQLVFVAFLKL